MQRIAAIVLGLLAAFSQAQEIPKPGPEHEMLKKQVGTWETTMKAGEMEFKGEVSFKMELSGLWLTGVMQSEMFGQKFTGKSLDGYDPIKKKYISVWVDSMSTAPVIMEGSYDKEKKALSLSGEGPGMDRKTTKYRSITKVTDEDTMVMTMYIGNEKEPAFVITYKRKK